MNIFTLKLVQPQHWVKLYTRCLALGACSGPGWEPLHRLCLPFPFPALLPHVPHTVPGPRVQPGAGRVTGREHRGSHRDLGNRMMTLHMASSLGTESLAHAWRRMERRWRGEARAKKKVRVSEGLPALSASSAEKGGSVLAVG